MANRSNKRETRAQIVALLAAEGMLTAGRVADHLGIDRQAAIRCLNYPLFEPVRKGQRTSYRLSEEGRRVAGEQG